MDIYFRHDHKCFNFRVAAIIKLDDNRILMSRFNEIYTLPGGRVRFGETTEKALKREIRATLGLEIKIDRLVSINENFFDYGSDEYHEVLFIYLCDLTAPIQEDIISENDEIYQFISINELINLKIKPEFLLEELKKLPIRITHNVNK
jgi:ADP-ribose pyrophosphatase YjhB (NUDIX family)